MSKNFTDKTRAEIFVRDKALCGFSGKSLWILDYGATPTYHPDWYDHKKPASKGGSNSLDNGIASASFFNWKKRNNSADNLYFFENGLPLYRYFIVNEFLTQEIASSIKRFSKLDTSDFYFNRAMYSFMEALQQKYDPRKINGEKATRTITYWTTLTLKHLIKWRSAIAENHTQSFEKRKIIKYNSEDVQLMLKLRTCTSVKEILKILNQVYPYYAANSDAIENMMSILEKSESKGWEKKLYRRLKQINNAKYITPRIKNMLTTNLAMFYKIHKQIHP